LGKISAEGVGRNVGRFYAVYGGAVFCFFDYVFLQQCGGIFESFGTAGWGIVFCSLFLKKKCPSAGCRPLCRFVGKRVLTIFDK